MDLMLIVMQFRNHELWGASKANDQGGVLVDCDHAQMLSAF